MRFLMTPEIDGIGIYPCSIDARVLTSLYWKGRPVKVIGYSLGGLHKQARFYGGDVRYGWSKAEELKAKCGRDGHY
jgi:hypothetical protein